jgi:hypothetical protein
MSKSNKGQQQLSPANYVRQKARSLPIYECRVNKNWKEFGMATVLVTRKHTNGNFTSGIYLVDILCLGVKDTTFQFNLKPDEYEEYVNHFMSRDDTEVIDYTLAHNIIYAGIEFSEEFEFKPHRDFVSTTQYILEEDSDDIEVIEIECGKDGKPTYVVGPNDSEQKIINIITQLERTAGIDNFYLVDAEGDYEEEYEDEDGDDETYGSYDKNDGIEDAKVIEE